MVSITLSVPDDLKQTMNLFPEINWSAVAREAIKKRINMMKFMEEFTKNSEMTQKDAIRLGRELNKKISQKKK